MPIKIIFMIAPLIAFSIYANYFTRGNVKPKSFTPLIHVSEFSAQGVVDRIIQIKIIEDHIAKSDLESVKINVQIQMPFDFEGPLEFKWILAENVHVKMGSNLTGVLKSLKANKTQTVSIDVVGFSEKENRQVAFQIWCLKSGRKLFADGIVSSQKEKTFEHIVQNVERIKAERNQ